MKKLFCVMLALMMACAMLAVTAEDAADYLGDWYLVEMKMGDTGMNPSDLGMNMTMTVNEDGTVLNVSAYGDTAEEGHGTWKLTENGLSVTDDTGVTVVFALNEAGQLVADMEGMGMVFGREQTQVDRKSTRLNSSHPTTSRMPSSA